jgi:hypothetical protein
MHRKMARLAHRCVPNLINHISVHAVPMNFPDNFSHESYVRSRGGQSSYNLLQSQRVSSANTLDEPLTRQHKRLGGGDARHSNTLGRAIAEEDKGGHGGDGVAAGNVLDVVGVDLDECHLALGGVLLSELREDRGDGAAGWAPVGVEVDGYPFVRCQDGVKLSGTGDLDDLGGGLRDGLAIIHPDLGVSAGTVARQDGVVYIDEVEEGESREGIAEDARSHSRI